MMAWSKFYDRVSEMDDRRKKAIWIEPKLDYLPLPIQRFDEPFFPLSKAIVNATYQHVGIYIFDFASYLATGAAGIVALERAIAYTRDKALVMLHGPFSGENYSILADDLSFNVDALTVTRQLDLEYYLKNPPYAAFWWDGDLSDGVVGGTLSHELLSLNNSEGKFIHMPVFHSNELLTDLSDSYADNITQQVQ